MFVLGRCASGKDSALLGELMSASETRVNHESEERLQAKLTERDASDSSEAST